MRRHWQYLKYVIRHKWFVLVTGIKLGVPIHLLILHDISKFRIGEWFPYARTFYAPNGGGQYEPESGGMGVAWNAHQKRNKHHWQYWMLTWDTGDTDCLPMPSRYRLEMLADWRGAGRAITGKDNTLDWYSKNSVNIQLHPETKLWLNAQLGYHFDFKGDSLSKIYFPCPFCTGYNGHIDNGDTIVNCTSSCGKPIDMYLVDPDDMIGEWLDTKQVRR